jgi:hypothetical protein
MSQTCAPGNMHAAVIRAAMMHDRAHALDQFPFRDVLRAKINFSANTAHGSVLLQARAFS